MNMAEISSERKQELDTLASIGATLGIFDADTLLDMEEFCRTTPPVFDAETNASDDTVPLDRR